MSKHSLDPELSGFIHNLRAALPYLEEFDQKTFVIYLSGELIEVQNSRVIEDLALLQQVGIRIVLVHGAELQIRNLCASQGLDYHTEDGIFVAEEKNIPLIEQVVSSANWKLLSRLRSCARQLQAFTGHFLLAEKKTFQKIMIPTLPEVFAVLTLKLLDRLLLTLNLQLYHLFHLEKRGAYGFWTQFR